MKKIEKIKKAVLVSFENYYSKIENRLVLGTIDVKKAINAVKKEQGNFRFVLKNYTILKNFDASDYDLDYAIKL